MIRDSIFISYSHFDRKWLVDIKKHLSTLEYNHQLEIWDDSKIRVGSIWKKEIEASIEKCKVAILLVSSNFLYSEFIRNEELPRILSAKKAKGIIIYNIILDACSYKLSPIGKYQCFNDPNKPLNRIRPTERGQELVRLTTEMAEIFTRQKNALIVKEGEDEPENFYEFVVLGCLVKRGAGTITNIQVTIDLKRKLIVSALDKLMGKDLVKKVQQRQGNQLTTLWEASENGRITFNQIEQLYLKL